MLRHCFTPKIRPNKKLVSKTEEKVLEPVKEMSGAVVFVELKKSAFAEIKNFSL